MTQRALIWTAVSTVAQTDDDQYSLPIQEADARALAERNGWRVVDTLRVPGHSRFYVDIHECAADMRAEGIDAFDKLLKHWKAKDFDVLIVRDGNRFARTQTLHAYVTEMTIRQGATLWSLSDGLIDEKNYRMWIAMNGYKAGSEVDTLVKRRKEVVHERAKNGLIAHSAVPSTHIVIRDPINGKAVKMVVDESRRRFWNDTATLILEGIGWHHIERALFERFGHENKPGEPHQPSRIYTLIRNPVFWGHIAFNHRPRSKDQPWAKMGDWIMEPGHPIPDGVTIYYNVTESVYTGEIAEAVKAEVRRRSLITGSATPGKTHAFTAVFVCHECNYYMATHGSWGRKGKTRPGYVKCMTHWNQSPTRPDCSQRKALSFLAAKAYIDKRLREMVAAEDPEAFLGTTQRTSSPDNLALLTKEIEEIEQRVRRLIRKQAEAGDNLKDIYEDEIQAQGEMLKRKSTTLAALEREQGLNKRSHAERQFAFDEIVRLSVDVFWQQEGRYINQLLHRLIGDVRFAVRGGEIIELVDKPPAPFMRRTE